MTVSNVVSPLLTYLDRFVVATIVGLAAIAYYTTPYEAVIRLTVVPEAVLGVLFPAMVAAMAADRASASDLYACTLRALLAAMTVIATVGVAFAAPLLGAWISPAFAAGSQHVLQILVVGVAINAVAWVPFSAIQSQGRADLTARLHLAELPLYLGVLYTLTQTFGVIGAALAWTLRASADFALLLAIQHRLMPTAYRVRASTVTLVPALWVAAWAVHDHAPSPWRAVLAWLVVAAAVAVAARGITTPDDRAAAIGAARQLAGRVGRRN
jgi:O-antigen/teichoic acid export membrane protein